MGHEVLTPFQHVDTLRVLVHPMFLVSDRFNTPDYNSSQREFADNAIVRFTPHTAGVVLLIMPNTASWQTPLQNFKFFAEVKKHDPTRLTWPDLYKKIKVGSPFSNNVRLVDNAVLVTDPDAFTILDKRLKRHRFFMDGKTEIILGGQWQDLCVEIAATKLLACKQVDEVKVDRHVVIASPSGFTELVYGMPYKITSDEDYYYYRRTV